MKTCMPLQVSDPYKRIHLMLLLNSLSAIAEGFTSPNRSQSGKSLRRFVDPRLSILVLSYSQCCLSDPFPRWPGHQQSGGFLACIYSHTLGL